MEEVWKEIENTEGKYLISNLGRLKTTSRNVKNRRNDKRFVKGVIRKTTPRRDGYCIASFYLDGKRWSKYVHHLVWKYFGDGIKSNHKITLDHKDGNKSNNKINNLWLLTSRENSSKTLRDKKSKSSKYIGVYWHKKHNRWISRIWVKGQRLHLGSFKTEIEAYNIYQKSLQQLVA